MSGSAFLFCKALKIILPVCLDEITGWFRLFQSTREIKAAFIYFYLFLLWADWAVSVRRLPVGLGRLDPGVSGCLGSAQKLHPSASFSLEMGGTSPQSLHHCAGSSSVGGGLTGVRPSLSGHTLSWLWRGTRSFGFCPTRLLHLTPIWRCQVELFGRVTGQSLSLNIVLLGLTSRRTDVGLCITLRSFLFLDCPWAELNNVKQTEHRSVVSKSVTGWPVQICDRVACPWNSLDRNTGVGNHSLLQGIKTSSQSRDRTRISCIAGRFFYCLSYQGSPNIVKDPAKY